MYSTKKASKLRIKYQPVITTFQLFIIQVFKEAEILNNNNPLLTRVKLFTEMAGHVDLSKLNKKSFDMDDCAYCEHRFIIPIVFDIQ